MGSNPGTIADVSSRLSCADSAFPMLSHAAALAVIRDLGFRAVDLCVFAGLRHNPPEAVIAEPRRIAEAVAERLDGLAVADVFVILGTAFDELAVNHPDPVVRDESLRRFERAVEFAHHLKAPGVTILPGTTFGGVDDGESLRRSATELQRRAEIADKAGLRLAIEPHYQSIVETPQLAIELLELAPDLALALDYSHFVYQGIAQEDVEMLIPRTGHVHLRQAGPGTMQAATRQGAIDFPRLLAALNAARYDGYLALEYQHEEWLECNRVDCISETAELRDLLLAAGAG